MGYHKTKIKKGKVGKFSKIKEEYQELKDAHKQNSPILELVEISDLLGAIELYIKKYNITIEEVLDMSRKTQSAFKENIRRSS